MVPIEQDVPRGSPLVRVSDRRDYPSPLGDALERLWKGEDSLIRSMLINSMKPQIGKP